MGHGRTNQPVVVKGERILQGQFAGVGMSLGIKGDEQKGRRRGKRRRIRKDKIKRGADREEWRVREREKPHKSVSGISLCGFLTHPNKRVEEEGASGGGTVGSSWH